MSLRYDWDKFELRLSYHFRQFLDLTGENPVEVIGETIFFVNKSNTRNE